MPDLREGIGGCEVGELAVDGFFNARNEVDTAEGRSEVYGGWTDGAFFIEAVDIRAHTYKEFLGDGHQIFQVSVSMIELARSELGIMRLIQSCN